jgi:hypothetical protein
MPVTPVTQKIIRESLQRTLESSEHSKIRKRLAGYRGDDLSGDTNQDAEAQTKFIHNDLERAKWETYLFYES